MAIEVRCIRRVGGMGEACDRRQVRGGDPRSDQVVLVGRSEQRHWDKLAVGGIQAATRDSGHGQCVLLGGEVHAQGAVDVHDVGHRPQGAVEGVAVEPVDLGLVKLAQGIEQAAGLLQGSSPLPALVADRDVSLLSLDGIVQPVAHLPVQRMITQARREEIDDGAERVDRVSRRVGQQFAEFEQSPHAVVEVHQRCRIEMLLERTLIDRVHQCFVLLIDLGEGSAAPDLRIRIVDV